MESPVLLLLVAAVTAATSDGNCAGFSRCLEARDTTAKINDYVDRVLNQTKVFLIENKMDPYELTEHYIVNFSFKDLLGIKWKTRMGLFNGQARDFSTIHREGDAHLSYSGDLRTLDLEAAVSFDDIVVRYKFASQFVNIGPSGVFIATVKNLNADLYVTVNLRTGKATLQYFHIKSAKSIKVKVTGLPLLGNLAVNAFINAFTRILKGPILKAIEAQLFSALDASVNAVDASPLFVDCTDSSSG